MTENALRDAIVFSLRALGTSGGRSALVGKTLKDMGYTNVRNLGGFKGWVDAGGAVEKG